MDLMARPGRDCIEQDSGAGRKDDSPDRFEENRVAMEPERQEALAGADVAEAPDQDGHLPRPGDGRGRSRGKGVHDRAVDEPLRKSRRFDGGEGIG